MPDVADPGVTTAGLSGNASCEAPPLPRGLTMAAVPEDPVEALPGIDGCVAYLAARVISTTTHDGHHLLVCQCVEACVRRDYWSGKTFAPQVPGLPPYMTFLGSKEFAYTTPAMAMT